MHVCIWCPLTPSYYYSSAKFLPYTAVLFAIGVLMGIGSGTSWHIAMRPGNPPQQTVLSPPIACLL